MLLLATGDVSESPRPKLHQPYTVCDRCEVYTHQFWYVVDDVMFAGSLGDVNLDGLPDIITVASHDRVRCVH